MINGILEKKIETEFLKCGFFVFSVLCPPSQPCAENIIKLEELTLDDGKEKFRTEYGWDGSVKVIVNIRNTFC